MLIIFPQALVETPSVQSAQKRAELLEEQRIQMEEKRRMKDEAARIARQQEFEEEQRLEVIMYIVLIFNVSHLCSYCSGNVKNLNANMKKSKVLPSCHPKIVNFMDNPPQLLKDERRLKMPQDL